MDLPLNRGTQVNQVIVSLQFNSTLGEDELKHYIGITETHAFKGRDLSYELHCAGHSASINTIKTSNPTNITYECATTQGASGAPIFCKGVTRFCAIHQGQCSTQTKQYFSNVEYHATRVVEPGFLQAYKDFVLPTIKNHLPVEVSEFLAQ